MLLRLAYLDNTYFLAYLRVLKKSDEVFERVAAEQFTHGRRPCGVPHRSKTDFVDRLFQYVGDISLFFGRKRSAGPDHTVKMREHKQVALVISLRPTSQGSFWKGSEGFPLDHWFI